MSKLKAVAFIAVIASGTFFANPTWGAEGLPRDAAGNVIINRWIQVGESFWINPTAWVHTYQNYCNQIPNGPGIQVQLPDHDAPESSSEEAQKPEPAPSESGEQAQPASPAPESATDSVAQPETDQADPTPDQAETPKPAAPRKRKPAAPKAAAAPAPETDPAPAHDQADQADPQE